jgi:arylsulfatase A-like enzyme
VILTAKHGNSPVDRGSLRWVDPGNINKLIDDAFPGVLAQVTADTMPLIWLKDRSKAGAVASLLQANADEIGAATITSGDAVGTLFGGELGGNPSRIPDIVVQGAPGVLYDTGTKLVDHGSGSAEDTHVPLVVDAPGVQGGVTLKCPVSLRQLAPTILQSLGLNPQSLDAVRLEGTKTLPEDRSCG